jgi:hypothetical protein
MPLLPERTIPYKSYVKAAIVEALREVFLNHPDSKLRKTKVSIEFPTSQLSYPAIVVRFVERSIENAGVGHVEFLFVESDDPVAFKFRHYLYHGDIEFGVYALSSLDRDLISDTLVQTLSMPDMAEYTENFFSRIYYPINIEADPNGAPGSDEDPRNKHRWNYLNLNTDRLSPMGETQTPQPWLSEDQLVYQSSYRVGIMGEFYSLPPEEAIDGFGTVQKVNVYPYLDGLESRPEGTPDSSSWSQADNAYDASRGEYDV